MAARSLSVALLLLGVGVLSAGCIGGKDDVTPGAVEGNDTLNTANPVDGDKKLIAFEETNQTEAGAGGVDHHHDYWNGQTRVVIFQRDAQMDPFPDDQNRALATFQPPQGALVFEGTNTVEFTISNPQRRVCEPAFTFDGDFICTDYQTGQRVPDATGGPAGLKLRYKHSSTTQWIDVGELTWGAPLSIAITDPRHTDMPHATSSLWEFQVVSPNANDVTLTFDAKAELVRGEGEIPLWPGHPNFYADRTSREVLNVPAEACDGTGGCALATEEAGPVFADKLVSYGTKSLHVWVNISEVQAPNPATAPNSWFLFHINATGRQNLTNPFDPEATIDKREFYWVFPVDDNGMDSPYADGSRWNFMLGGSLTTPVISCYAGCADWFATYTLVVHATSEELPFEQYTYYCLRDDECPAPEGGGGQADDGRTLYARR